MALPPVLDCTTNAYTGKNVLVDVAFGCGDVPDPRDLSFMPFGAMRTKSLNISQDTNDATADDTVGFFREMIGSYKNFTFSGDGVARAKDGSRSNVVMLTKYFMTVQQANVWTRITYPDITVIFYGMINDMSRESPNDDVATYSFEVTATSSDHGVIVDDTPDTTVAVTGVTMLPKTLALKVGATGNVAATVAPAGANQVVLYTSTNEAAAKVNAAGVVTATGVGTAIITALAVGNMSKTDTCTVTVTAP